ncbi:AMP-binding protein [Mycobacterium sp. 141]|uniref:AMP-binding protein n=1 Tax=Mycobacterium sp. 141 TaxID=1120797 RepID=UPI0003AABF56|nr:AMP-binding protein [Mycobacterium sp. 141]
MPLPESASRQRIPLSAAQRNIYHGVLQAADPALYLIGRHYRFHPLQPSRFLAALHAMILANPIQLCVLDMASGAAGYPDLVPQLQVDDIVGVRVNGGRPTGAAGELSGTWASGLFGKPLVRYTVYLDSAGLVSGLGAYSHHIVVDGGATGILEAHLGRRLVAANRCENTCVSDGLDKVAAAHRREAGRISESLERLTPLVERELTADARAADHGHESHVGAMAAIGVLNESAVISGSGFDAILDLADQKRVPLNVLLAAAATAVDASIRQSTQGLLVHAVDNRFGDPDLDVVTCLVNSVAQPIRFAPFASVADVVRTLDRGYVNAGRRRWFREELYRRRYLAINRTSAVDALTLNFLREPCAPELRPFLSDTPVTTDIGPIEGMTVAAVLDQQKRTLTLNIWNKAGLGSGSRTEHIGDRIAAVLAAMPSMWEHPVAMIVDEWSGIADDGTRRQAAPTSPPENPAPAWFLDASWDRPRCLQQRRHVLPWVSWLIGIGAEPGDVLVLIDDNTDKTVDLLIAAHLAGCGYSVCDRTDQMIIRAERIAELGVSTHIVDIGSATVSRVLDEGCRDLLEARLVRVAQDPHLAAKTAYVMPTSGSTGEPKLIPVSHNSLAVFIAAVVRAYGWGPNDTVLQCALLTSDISVEEVFGAALSGATLIRSTAMKRADLQALTRDLVTHRSTIVDLPTAVWHLLCDDDEAIEAISRSQLRQIVIGGEAIRPSTVAKWVNTDAAENISLISSYGPTETTVVVTYLPITGHGHVVEPAACLRLGRPIIPNTVVIAFGEIVVVGEMVAAGYLGQAGPSFGTVAMVGGAQYRAFATGDRIAVDQDGYPVFSGRKDAIVKVSGMRVDTAEITGQIVADPAVSDVAVKLHNGGLGVWFETSRTRRGVDDPAVAARIRSILVSARVPSFFLLGVEGIARKPNGKIDVVGLPAIPASRQAGSPHTEPPEKAAGLAAMWSRQLDRVIAPEASLLREGVGSLDLIRILPDTRRYLGRHISILDVIGADSAANLVATPIIDTWMDADTAAAIDRDFAALATRRADDPANIRRPAAAGSAGPILVLGAAGILGTGFAAAVRDFAQAGVDLPPVVLAMRSIPPARGVWTALSNLRGVRIEHLAPKLGPAELATLIRETGARTLVNCIGSTNVLVPYRELRRANVELVAAMAEACAITGTRLVHLSTYVVNAEAAAPQVVDPREAPYPYAASKSLAELAVAGAPEELDFSIVRLPRVLGEPEQIRESADILVSIVDACRALRVYPMVELTEEVTTGRAAARSILRRLPELAGPAELGRGIDVLRGEAVGYPELLSTFADDPLDVLEWRRLLDESDWARRNPRRWSVIDAWIGLGTKLGGRSYARYLADYPALALGIESVAELVAMPASVDGLLAHGCSP